MSFDLLVNNNNVTIEFNYRLMYKINRAMATISKDTGISNNNGVGNFFVSVLNQDDEAIIELVKLVRPELKEEDILAAIEARIGIENTEESYDKLFKDLQDEMVASGFFKAKISSYIKMMSKGAEFLEAQDDEESKLQAVQVKEQLSMMKAAIA